MKLTRFATLGCQKFVKSKCRRGHNLQTKRPIAKISPLLTLQLLILTTGARFKVILCTFKGTFISLFFGLWHPWRASMAGLAVPAGARVAKLDFFSVIKGIPDLSLLINHLKPLEVINWLCSLVNLISKGAKLQLSAQKNWTLLP